MRFIRTAAVTLCGDGAGSSDTSRSRFLDTLISTIVHISRRDKHQWHMSVRYQAKHGGEEGNASWPLRQGMCTCVPDCAGSGDGGLGGGSSVLWASRLLVSPPRWEGECWSDIVGVLVLDCGPCARDNSTPLAMHSANSDTSSPGSPTSIQILIHPIII